MLKLYFVPASKTTEITKEIVDQFMIERASTSWIDFDALIEMEASLLCVVANKEEWTKGKCSSPYFSKNYKCIHLIAISIDLKLDDCIIPLTGEQIPLGKNVNEVPHLKQRKLSLFSNLCICFSFFCLNKNLFLVKIFLFIRLKYPFLLG